MPAHCRSFRRTLQAARSARPTTTLPRPGRASSPSRSSITINLALRIPARLAAPRVGKFNLAARPPPGMRNPACSAGRPAADSPHATLRPRPAPTSQMRSSPAPTRRLRQQILHARQFAQRIDALQHRAPSGQARAIDSVRQARCHGPRIIGPVPTPVKTNPVQVFVFEVSTPAHFGLDLELPARAAWRGCSCRFQCARAGRR
jgi:hypothetical protein